jgi:hypothetical protein
MESHRRLHALRLSAHIYGRRTIVVLRVSFARPMKSSDSPEAFIDSAESRDVGLSLMIYLLISRRPRVPSGTTFRVSAVAGNEAHPLVDELPYSGESIVHHENMIVSHVAMS